MLARCDQSYLVQSSFAVAVVLFLFLFCFVVVSLFMILVLLKNNLANFMFVFWKNKTKQNKKLLKVKR